MYKTNISISQLLRTTNDIEREFLQTSWVPQIGDWYYDPRFNFPCIVPQEVDLSYYKGDFVPLMNEGQLLRFIGATLRPKVFKVTKGQQRYYRRKHNPSVKLPVGWWAVWSRKAHKNAWQHKVYTAQFLVDALWEASGEVLEMKTVV